MTVQQLKEMIQEMQAKQRQTNFEKRRNACSINPLIGLVCLTIAGITGYFAYNRISRKIENTTLIATVIAKLASGTEQHKIISTVDALSLMLGGASLIFGVTGINYLLKAVKLNLLMTLEQHKAPSGKA
jgi:hypothetical protein